MGWVDSLEIRDRTNEPTTALRDLLYGRCAFIFAGGPSTASLPLERLNRRGCWTLGINNAAGLGRFRPQAFTCSDPSSKFSQSIWLDPGIMKIVPIPKLNGGPSRSGLRIRNKRGLERLNHPQGGRWKVKQCPNVWGYERRSWMAADETFFTEPGAAWGNHNSGVLRTGEPKTVCTLLLAMRLMRYLGAEKVFLVGVDFKMTPTSGYSFPQGRTEGACESNNRQFTVVNDWLCRMQNAGVFHKFGINYYNCNPISGLRAFPYVSFDQAIEMACDNVEPNPDLSGWYDK